MPVDNARRLPYKQGICHSKQGICHNSGLPAQYWRGFAALKNVLKTLLKTAREKSRQDSKTRLRFAHKRNWEKLPARRLEDLTGYPIRPFWTDLTIRLCPALRAGTVPGWRRGSDSNRRAVLRNDR